MTLKNTSASLGVLCLDRGSSPQDVTTPIPGTMRSAATFEFPVILETVPGAWVENVVRGDPALEVAYVAAAQRLVERGAIAISSNCGFSVRHQAAIAAAVNVPVLMSSLLLLPTLLRQLPSQSKIAVLTYDSRHCGDDVIGIDNKVDRARIVIGGIEGGKFWQDELKRPVPPIDVAAMQSDVIACVTRLRALHPEVTAILFECAGFPIAAPAARRVTGLPIYDVTDLCRMTMACLSRE